MKPRGDKRELEMQALQRENARLSAQVSNILDNPGLKHCVMRADTSYLRVSDSYCALVGRPRGWLLEHKGTDIVHPADLPEVIRALGAVAGGAQPDALWTKRLVHGDGHVIWTESHVVEIGEEKGERLFMVQTHDVSQRVHWEAEMAAQQRRLDMSQAVGHVGTWERDLVTGQGRWSDQMKRIHLLHPDEPLPSWEQFASWVHSDDLPGLVDPEYHGVTDSVYRWVKDPDNVRVIADSNIWMAGDGDHPGYRLGTSRDITDQVAAAEEVRLAQMQLAESENNYRLLIDTAQDAIITIDAQDRVEAWNGAAELLFGWSASEAIGANLTELIVPSRLRERHEVGLARMRCEQPSQFPNSTVEIAACHRASRTFPVELSMWPHQKSGERKYSAIIRDISERKEREERSWHEANFDALTGLANRRLLENRLEQAVAQADRHRVEIVCLFIDLDGFKLVNDTYGHAVGDELLRQVARRLQGALRPGDTIARVGGDEFVLVLSDAYSGDEAGRTVAATIAAALSEPFRLGEHRATISGSVGVAVFPRDAKDADALISAADTAMYEAKHAGRRQLE